MNPDALHQFVSELLQFLGVAVDSVEVQTGHRTVVVVASPEGERLVGPGGEHLRALNAVARRLAEARHGSEATGFLIDVNGYHESQLERVRSEARVLAQRARLFKHDVEMNPMSSYERLVVHELFAEDPQIETQSAGEGKFRHIVLKYKNA
jgi:spoIIIJ-associated protein